MKLAPTLLGDIFTLADVSQPISWKIDTPKIRDSKFEVNITDYA